MIVVLYVMVPKSHRYTVKKVGGRVSRPQPGCHLPNSPWTGIIKLFRAWESLVSDIPAGDGKIANLFNSLHLIIIKVMTGLTCSKICFLKTFVALKSINVLLQNVREVMQRVVVVQLRFRDSA